MRIFDRLSLLIWSLILFIVAIQIGYLLHFRNSQLIWDFIHLTGSASGWVGCALMLMALLYIPRKCKLFTWGKMRAWYRFHVVTGMTGPVLIILHSYGKYYGFGGLAMFCMWVVFFTGVIGHYIYRRLDEEIQFRTEVREDILRNLDTVEGYVRDSATNADQLRQDLSDGGPLVGLEGGRLPRPVLKKNPREIIGLWRKYRAISSETNALKQRVLVQSAAEHRIASLRKHELIELLALERDAKNIMTMKEIFSLWRVCHVPVSWLMWVLVGLHFFGWVYY